MVLESRLSSGKETQPHARATIVTTKDYFEHLSELIRRVPYEVADDIASILLRAYTEGRKIFLFGNGGSASLASHFACDLGKGATLCGEHTRHFRVIALTDNIPLITAWANDLSYDEIFARQLRNLIEARDVAFAISGSGNSANVVKALSYAKDAGAQCVGLTGFGGGKMKTLCSACLVVPSDNMQLIEDVHLSVTHSLFTTIRRRLELGLLGADTKMVAAAL